MNNDIKEILDDLDYCKNRQCGNILLKHNECDLLLDYITNLQEEIERLNNIIEELEKYCNEDDWTSVNGEIAIKLIKIKLKELKEGKE